MSNRMERSTSWAVVALALVGFLGTASSVVAQMRFFPAPGVQEEYRIRLGAYSADGAPTLVTAMNLRLTGLEDNRLQLDVLKAERFDPFGQYWLNLIVDSIHTDRSSLPEDVQARLILSDDADILAAIPDDIPDAAFGLLLEMLMFVHVPFSADALSSLAEPGDSVTVGDVALRWFRARTGIESRREGPGGVVTLESLDDDIAVLRWEPGAIQWASLFHGPRNRASLGTETYELALVINTDTGEIVSATTLNDMVAMRVLGIVEYDSLPDWDEFVVPEDAPYFGTKRVIKLQRMSDYLDEQSQKDAPPVMGPLPPQQ